MPYTEPTRRRILDLLAQGERATGDLARAFPLRAFWEGWLSKYQRFWDDRLAALKELVESEERRDGHGDRG